MYSQKRKYGIGYLSVCVVVSVMTGISEFLSVTEIIFPEIAALATGMLAAPKQSWRVSRSRMVFLIAASTVMGTLLAKMSVTADFSLWALWLRHMLRVSCCFWFQEQISFL